MEDWVEVYSAMTVTQVYIFKAALEDAGISTWVENEALQGAYGGLSGAFFSGSLAPKLMVPKAREQEALHLIHEIETAQGDEINDDE